MKRASIYTGISILLVVACVVGFAATRNGNNLPFIAETNLVNEEDPKNETHLSEESLDVVKPSLSDGDRRLVDELTSFALREAPNRVCPFTVETFPPTISLGKTRLRYEYKGDEMKSDMEKNAVVSDLIGDVVYVRVKFTNPYDEPAAALGVSLFEYDEEGKIWCWLADESNLYNIHYTIPKATPPPVCNPSAMMGAFPQSLLRMSNFERLSNRVWKTLQPGETSELYFAFELNPWVFCGPKLLKKNADGFFDLKELNVFSDRLPISIYGINEGERREMKFGVSIVPESVYEDVPENLIAPSKPQSFKSEFRQCDLPLFESGEDSISFKDRENYSVFADKIYSFVPVVVEGMSASRKALWKDLYRRDFEAELYTFQFRSSKQKRIAEMNYDDLLNYFRLIKKERAKNTKPAEIDYFEDHFDWIIDDYAPTAADAASEQQQMYKRYVDLQFDVLSYFNDSSNDDKMLQAKLDEIDAFLKSVPEIPRGFYMEHLVKFFWESEIDWKTIIEGDKTISLGSDIQEVFDDMHFEIFQYRKDRPRLGAEYYPDEASVRKAIEEAVKSRKLFGERNDRILLFR